MNHRLITHLLGAAVCLASCVVGSTVTKVAQIVTVGLCGAATVPELDEGILIVDGNSGAPIVVTNVRFAGPRSTSDVLIEVRNDADRDAKIITFLLEPVTAENIGIPMYPIVDYGEEEASCWFGLSRQVGPPLRPGESVTIVITRDTYENRPLARMPLCQTDRVPRLWLSEVVYTDDTTFSATSTTTTPPN